MARSTSSWIDRAVKAALLVPFVVAMVIHGSTKPGPGQRPSRFVMDEYLIDAGSYSTNSTVHLAATKLSAQIPDDTPLLAYAALMGTTNWTELLPRRTYADLPADWSLADATNYDYIVMLDWVPPAPVVTNDILTVNALAAKGSTPPGTTLHAVLPRVALVTPIESLESTGTQWIDTGIKPAQELAFSCSFSFEGATKEFGFGNIFGSRRSSGVYEYQLTGVEGGSVSIGTRNRSLGFRPVVINTVSFDGANTVNINGASRSIVTSTCAPTKGSIVLFGIRQNGAVAQLSKSKIYSLKFILNGVLVRDFQPVRVGRVGYLFDRVSGELFGNAGTGAFILGPDITE